MLAASPITSALCTAAASYVRLCVRCCWVLAAAEVCAPPTTACATLCSVVALGLTAAATSYVRLCAGGATSAAAVCAPKMRRDRAAKSTKPGCRLADAGAGWAWSLSALLVVGLPGTLETDLTTLPPRLSFSAALLSLAVLTLASVGPASALAFGCLHVLHVTLHPSILCD